MKRTPHAKTADVTTTPAVPETPVTPVTPVTPEVVKPANTAEDKKEFMKAFGFRDTAVKPDAAPPVDTTVPVVPPVTPAPVAPVEPVAPKKKAKKVEPAAPVAPLTKQDVTDAVAAAVKPVAPVPEEEEAPVELDQDEQDRIAAIQIMEESGKAPKGTADKILKFWKKEEAYSKRWEAQHPGEEFDIDDPAHAEFYKNEPEYDGDSFDEASQQVRDKRIAETAAAEASEKVRKELGSEITAIKAKAQMAEMMPVIKQNVDGYILNFVEHVDPDLAKLFEGKLTPEGAQKIEEADPVSAQLLDAGAYVLGNIVGEMEKVEKFKDWYSLDFDLCVPDADGKPFLFNGQPIYPHREMINFAIDLEDKIVALPKEDQDWDGRQFITVEGYKAEIEKIHVGKGDAKAKKAKIEALDTRVWKLDHAMIREKYVKKFAGDVKQGIKKINELYEKRAKKAAPAAVATTPSVAAPVATPPVVPPVVAVPKPTVHTPPSLSSAGDKVTPASAGGKTVSTQAEEVRSSMFPRR